LIGHPFLGMTLFLLFFRVTNGWKCFITS
jgi:hypothetical protein